MSCLALIFAAFFLLGIYGRNPLLNSVDSAKQYHNGRVYKTLGNYAFLRF